MGLIDYYNSRILVAMKDLLLQVRCWGGGREREEGGLIDCFITIQGYGF